MVKEIRLKHGFNCRDLGGYNALGGASIKYGKLVRSGYLTELNAVDQKELYDYGIRTVIDLRSPREVTLYPDQLDCRIVYLKIPLSRQNLTDGETKFSELKGPLAERLTGFRQMMKGYQKLICSGEAQHAYRQFFDALLESPAGGVLFHCSTGKDRTGIITILLLKLLDIPINVIKQDYLLSNYFLSRRINERLVEARMINTQDAFLQSIFDVSSVREDYFNQVLMQIKQDYGGFDHYFHNQLNLHDEEVQLFKDRFLA
ncbi:MAG: tyrosine-protein phosphatase [Levilactobacillus sp.]|uniref:tyrosine-protein phosphatase n=1 Tax=Levilactobacillus sp. TaxID=2767919 RepID=UPI00258AB36E|nr:tyrosine-protein phosphatase [Levilactobacillus sp.]MCI1553214.1 tyrosine-protein phosphatase [Levilactobacillus sp.]